MTSGDEENSWKYGIIPFSEEARLSRGARGNTRAGEGGEEDFVFIGRAREIRDGARERSSIVFGNKNNVRNSIPYLVHACPCPFPSRDESESAPPRLLGSLHHETFQLRTIADGAT